MPVPIRQYTYQIQDDYYHLRIEVIYAEQMMVQQRQQKESRERERARIRAARGPRHFVHRGRAGSAGASTSSHPYIVRTMYFEQPKSEEDPEEDPEDDPDEDPEDNSESSDE